MNLFNRAHQNYGHISRITCLATVHLSIEIIKTNTLIGRWSLWQVKKNYISVYVCSIEDGHYLAELYKERLGTVSVGKSCIRFKKLSDINLDTLKEVIQKASVSPGL